jgi:beta-glucosidase
LVDVLSGDVNPSGRLPFTFPVQLEDCGAHAFDALCYPGDTLHEVYREDLMVGYRWNDNRKVTPLFAFGYGLSYTTFVYGDARISATQFAEGDTLTVTVPVTNTGGVTGAEVVQLYVGDDHASVVRPLKELKAFSKVTLAPGETRDVPLRVAASDLAYYDDQAKAWRAEAGTFNFHVAAAANDVRQTLSARLKQGFLRAR